MKKTKYDSPIGTISFALNGTQICVGAIALLWATTVGGTTFPVASINDRNTPDFLDGNGRDFPFYDVVVTDYNGRTYDFCDLTGKSQDDLCDFVIDELF